MRPSNNSKGLNFLVPDSEGNGSVVNRFRLVVRGAVRTGSGMPTASYETGSLC